MNYPQAAQTVTSQLNYWQDKPVSEDVLEPIVITIPQRRAQYHCKDRLRWVDAKRMALAATGCVDTAEVKKWLKFLDVRGLRLNMTLAWVAVRHDLATKIKIARNKLAPTVAKVVDLAGYKLGARSAKDCAKNWKAVQEHRELERQNNINIIVTAMKEAIAASNWEFLRQALVSREKYKSDAWAILTATEQQQLEAIVPVEIRLLKAALKRGAIAAFKEDEEGGMFWIWQNAETEPELFSGTTIHNFYGSL